MDEHVVKLLKSINRRLDIIATIIVLWVLWSIISPVLSVIYNPLGF